MQRTLAMNDDNWENLNGPVAREIEVLNHANQINVLNGLIMFLLEHRGPTGMGMPPMPDNTALLNLHHAGTLFLLSDPGCYRNTEVVVADENDNVIHKPPPWQMVTPFMQHFFRELSSVWTSGDALDAAAYALWRINWIHPFKNGNGRTARAFCYACLCLKMGVLLPGRQTVVELITHNRTAYEASLRAADASPNRRPDLGPMRAFLDSLLQQQIQTISP